MKTEVVKLDELCTILHMETSTGRKHWRKWPHFFPTDGRDARSVRFIPEQVIAFLGVASGSFNVPDQGRTILQGHPLHERGYCSQQARISDKKGCKAVDAETRNGFEDTILADAKRHGIFLGGDTIPQ